MARAQNADDLPWHLSVKVVSESGEALSGVMFLEDLENPDDAGHYVIRFPPNKYRKYELIRFSLNGYIPVTKVVERGTPKLAVVLQKGENKWIPKRWPPSEETYWIGWNQGKG